MNIMAFSPITSWQIEGETVETVTDFLFLGSKITVGGDCSHEIKRCLLLGKKAMTNLWQKAKSKDSTLPTNVCLVKAMVFPVVMYGCESWIIQKAECQRIDTFELWCWIRLQRVPWTARKSNQLILKEINPEYSLEELIPKLKLQCFGHLIQSQLIGKDSDPGKDWGQEEKWVTEDEMVGWHHWLNGYEFEQTPGDSGGQGSLACCRSTGSLRVRHTLVTERQQSVTEVGLIHRPSISQAGSHPSIPQRSATQQMPKEFKRARTPCSVND